MHLRTALLALTASAIASPPAEARTLYVAERYDGIVRAIDTDTGASEAAAFGLGAMIGAAVDRRGRLFVHRFDDQTIALVDPVAHTFADVVTGIGGHGLFADPDEDALYLAGFASGQVYKLSEGADGIWSVDVVAEGLGTPIGAYRIGDILYISDRDGALYAKDLVGGSLTLVVGLPSGGEIIDREAGGDLIIGTSASDVYRVNLATRSIVRVYEGFINPAGIAVDSSDNSVMVCEHDGARVLRLNLATDERTVVTTGVETPWQPAFAREAARPRLSIAVTGVELNTGRGQAGGALRLRGTFAGVSDVAGATLAVDGVSYGPLTFDLAAGTWSLRLEHTDTSGLTPADGLDVVLQVGALSASAGAAVRQDGKNHWHLH